MLFSILIAHYNNFEYFKDCYASILKQSYQEYEIILVDDCSSDDSFRKIKEFTKDNPKIKIFRNEENKGVGFTKRKCAEFATGKICGFLDPDDSLAENALELSIKSHKSENIVATHSQIQLCNNNLETIKLFNNTSKVKNGNPHFLNINFEANHFFTFKKSAYDKTNGINQELTSAVDQDLYLKLYEIGNFFYIEKPLYYYRIHDKGVSQEKAKKATLNKNWHQVIFDTLQRRKIPRLYGKNISEIENLPAFVFKKQNTLFAKLKKKFI